eukprot:TRINITY_DN12390_c0_g1_i1.p1 TRINITY_DN12390_c0_g1~~TRINITY_DN12390_c0_g1_i1.p1  ORF type:complete len:252 (+),score=53.35 TRINITY_DN12390_c0_g1_i1:331-1086(+)
MQNCKLSSTVLSFCILDEHLDSRIIASLEKHPTKLDLILKHWQRFGELRALRLNELHQELVAMISPDDVASIEKDWVVFESVDASLPGDSAIHGRFRHTGAASVVLPNADLPLDEPSQFAQLSSSFQAAAAAAAASAPEMSAAGLDWRPEMLMEELQSTGSRTVELRNLPSTVTRQAFLIALNMAGFEGLYDFAYLNPGRSSDTQCAIINLATEEALAAFIRFWWTFDCRTRRQGGRATTLVAASSPGFQC